ncbi:TetR/AcrR family transcriptional regulator [Dactylosporangium sp. CA-139066]|uniref:TetR/AcrR family transcriptional regulator n=1 Tax=Dactylosporangium sp. CA-139066 TaxID=3239930 RepID=UPI003D89EFCE
MGDDRKGRLADAAIEVLGTEGLRALTHRAVDTRAGLPQGTCSYHFPTRNALLTATLERIAELDLAESADRDLASVLTAWSGSPRTRARFMLMLDPQARRDLGESAARLADAFVDRAERFMGSRPRARLLIGLIDGLLLDELTRGPVPDEERRDRLAAIAQLFPADFPVT